MSRIRSMARITATAVLLATASMAAATLIAPAAHAAADIQSKARDTVKRLGDDVINVISNENLDSSGRERSLRNVLETYMDVDWLARFVLGANWRTATPEQRNRYMNAYAPYIIKTYARRFNEYTGETIDITDSRMEQDGSATVFAVINRKGEADIQLQFRVGSMKGKLRVMDIVVEGVSQLNTQRSEFSSVISRKGLDYLISRLEERAHGTSSSSTAGDVSSAPKAQPVF
jgi:phospholipid transport system substrate-binding protein